MNNLLDTADLVEFVQVNVMIVTQVAVDAVIARGHDGNCLSVVHDEELGLTGERVLKLEDLRYHFSLEVECD